MNLTASADFPTPPSLFSTLKKEKLIVNLNDFHNKCDEPKKKKSENENKPHYHYFMLNITG